MISIILETALETQIRAWLNSDRDYNAGLELLKQVSGNKYVLRKMEKEKQTPGSMFYSEYRSRMIHLLRLYLNPGFIRPHKDKEYIKADKKPIPLRTVEIKNKPSLDKEIEQ